MRYIVFIVVTCFMFSGCNNDAQKAEANNSISNEAINEAVALVTDKKIDWQAHRGGRGLMPENSIAAFLSVLQYTEVTTLELDICVSKDKFLVVSHEPWMSAAICNEPDGTPIKEAKEKEYNLYEMKYIDITEYDCGSRGNERFPEQKKLSIGKPRLGDVVTVVDQRSAAKKLPYLHYNIEMKSNPEWYKIYHPAPADFAKLVVDEIVFLGIRNRVTVQSFDPRALQAVRNIDPTIELALLVENEEGVEANIEKLGFTPQIYSPYHKLLTKAVVKEVQGKSMRVIPWTVNEVDRMKELIAMGVDGIITDYPDRIGKVVVE
ncbi:MAG: glycerophosphodiester phosphodiesterase family protein [Bacteroidota bacterium]